MPRGGPRRGVPGASYPNRRDLQLAPRAAPGQTYGEAGSQIAAQRAVPVAAPPTAAPPAQPAAAPAGPFAAPGSLGALDRPSDRPDIPVTAGAALGPGPGPEAIAPAVQPEGIDPDLAALARHLPTLELLAHGPTATVATRNFVRRLRGIVPPQV